MRPRFLPTAQRPHLLFHACVLLVFSSAAAAAPFDILDAVQDATLLNGARSIAVSPDGAHVYVAALFASSVVAFAVDPVSGALTSRGALTNGVGDVIGLGSCADLAMSPDGRHLYVASFGDGAIAILSRDGATGALAFVDAIFDADIPGGGVAGASGVAVSSDGRHVYATASGSDAVTVFSRDPESGLLTWIETEGNVPPRLLYDPADLAISPDDALVYVVTQGMLPDLSFADSLLTFSRNTETGDLTLIDTDRDGFEGVTGLELPNNVVPSPDLRHVYTAAGLSDAVAFFSRSPLDGKSAWIGLISNAAPGVDGLDAAVGIAISQDGALVLATGVNDAALAVFTRDASTGLLAFDRAIRDDAAPGRLLGGAIDVAIARDGRFAYVAAFTDDALTVFAPECGALAGGLAACAALAFRRRRAVETC